MFDEQEDGVYFRWLRVRRYARSASVARVLSWLDFEYRLWRMDERTLPRPDIIIVSSLSVLTVLNGIRLARKFRVPWVFEVRDIWPLTLTAEGGFSRWHPLTLILGAVERLGYRHADAVVGTMPNLSPHASAIAGRPIAAHCIPFGFEPSAVPVDLSPAPLPKVRQADGQLIVGYAGSLGLTNALDTIIETAIRLRDDSRFLFVFVGDGALREAYQRRTAGCQYIHWVGRVNRSEVPSYLQQCDLLYFSALPSPVWEYGMSPNKLMDYLLAARPVLASYSGFPSLINEAGCGEFIPAGDERALVEALERFRVMPPQERLKLGARGRTWLLANRTWDRLARNYAELLDSLVVRARSKEIGGTHG